MGRYLDMARDTKNLAVLPAWSPPVNSWPCFPLPNKQAPESAEEDFDGPASTALDILVKVGEPVSHSGIVKALVKRGYDKTEAKQAIARCQKWGWIEHDLRTGYALS